MKYKTLIRRNSFLLSLLCAVVWLTGCVQDEFNTALPTSVDATRFALTVSDVNIPSVSSRAMSGTGTDNKEDEVKTVDILVFDNSKSPAVFLEWSQGKNITQDLANNTSTVEFEVALSPTLVSTRIVVVANRQLNSIVSGFIKGTTTKAEVMAELTHTLTDKWPADGSTADGYTPIPMYGEKVVAKLDHSSINPISGISMKRMLARIDVRNSTSNFKVEEVYLANYNTKGYLAPLWDTNGELNTSTPDALNIPGDSGKKKEESDALSYPVNGSKVYDGEIYTFEAAAAVDAGGVTEDNDVGRKEAVCLIVKGKIDNGPSTFYRIDFTQTGQKGEQVGYLPLKRNHKYIISITEALGAGNASLGEALASYTVMSNLKFRVIHYDRDKVKDVVYNGQYMLGVGEPEIKVTQYQNNSYAVDIFTDTPGGWKATVTEGDWLKFNVGGKFVETATGAANEDTQLMLRLPYFNEGTTGKTRTATVTLTSGRLTHEIKVTQEVINPGVIKFVDAYGNVLENGLFFPIVNPDDESSSIEAQTVYVMFSMDKIGVKLKANSDDETPRYDANTGWIPTLNRTTTVEFSDRVQAFTVQPNPRKPTDGTNQDPGWWWRWDLMEFNLYDKEGYFGQVTFPINQGDLVFSFRYYPVTTNSRTYKVYLGAKQYLQLFTNNNWEIVNIEQLNIVGDDGTGLIRLGMDEATDTDDLIVGRKNADEKMYKESVAYGDDLDHSADDIVDGSYDFRLKLHPGKWQEGKSGTIRITFKNVIHTKNNELFPFYRTIDLQMVSEVTSYTTSGQPLFHLYPVRFDNRMFAVETIYGESSKGYQASIADAEAVCANIGGGWRLPTVSELLMSYVYSNALGGSAEDYSYAYGQNIYGWYKNWSPDWENYYWSSSYYAADGPNIRFRLNFQNGYAGTGDQTEKHFFRCVKDNANGGTKYPYLTKSATGVTIVSRDNNGGVASSALFGSGETPDAVNKVAPKLLVDNASYTNKTWEEAKADCIERLGTGWRLPTQYEMILLFSMGGTSVNFVNQGFGESTSWTGSGFTKLDGGVHWTLTEYIADHYWVLGPDGGKLTGWGQDKTANWPRYRCVKTVN